MTAQKKTARPGRVKAARHYTFKFHSTHLLLLLASITSGAAVALLAARLIGGLQ